jgi:hypothetical protein
MGVVVSQFAGRTEAQITAAVADRIARAALLTDPEMKLLALDFNARLVTQLRVLGLWPARYHVEEFR